MAQYKVSPNGSIVKPKGATGMWMPGDIITDRDLPNDKIKEHLKSGYLLPYNAPVDPTAVPGEVTAPAIPHETELDKRNRAALQTSGGPTQTAAAEELRVNPDDTSTKVSMGGNEPPPSMKVVSGADRLAARAAAAASTLPAAPAQVLDTGDKGEPVVRDAKPGEPVTTAEGDRPAGAVMPGTNTPVGAASISPWTFNPAELAGKDLTALNILIQERDSKIQPFETVEEATAFLSQDHGKTK